MLRYLQQIQRIRRPQNILPSLSLLSGGKPSSQSFDYNKKFDRKRYYQTNKCSTVKKKSFSTEAITEERESMPCDVLIVGGGIAGLSTSIRLKQLCNEHDLDLSITIIEKGSEIGAHVLSGNVFDPKALQELFPEKRDTWMAEFLEHQDSYATPVSKDTFSYLSSPEKSFEIPNVLLPKQLHNEGNYIISLGKLCRWLGSIAEDMGIDIYPGFAASEVLYANDAVIGVATKDVGIGKDGIPKETFEPGVELLAGQTIFAEGARGSCSEEIISKFNLRSSSSGGDEKLPQTYGLGIKEVWEIPKDNYIPGFVQHTLGWPLQNSLLDKTFGGSFLYHQEPNLVLAGFVVGLDYPNPYLNPYKEFQRWKTHPDIAKHFKDGECISYGARVLNEGGYHSIPKLTFPGGMLVGCSAGFLNTVKIKGSHTALKSGMLAAESIFERFQNNPDMIMSESDFDEDEAEDGSDKKKKNQTEITEYESKLMNSWIKDELYEVRNVHAAFAKWGLLPGLAYAGASTFIFGGKEPWTLKPPHSSDSEATQPKDQIKGDPIEYPSPDGVLTFDLLTNLQRSGTFHDDDQPSHLKIKPDLMNVPEALSMQIYAAPEQRFCPAGVYEYVDDNDSEDGQEKKLVINAQNCVHCKCCSIKMPHEYINWTVPEGGGGPNYQNM